MSAFGDDGAAQLRLQANRTGIISIAVKIDKFDIFPGNIHEIIVLIMVIFVE